MGSMPFFCASGGASRRRCVRRAGLACCTEVFCAEVFCAEVFCTEVIRVEVLSSGVLRALGVSRWESWVGMALLYRLARRPRGIADLSDTHLRLWE